METFKFILLIFLAGLLSCDAPSLLLSPSLDWEISTDPKEICLIHGTDNRYPSLKKITLEQISQKSNQVIYFYSNVTLPEDAVIDQLILRTQKESDFVFDTDQNAFYYLGMIDLETTEEMDSFTLEHYISHPENYIFAVPELQTFDANVIFEFQRLGSEVVPDIEVIIL